MMSNRGQSSRHQHVVEWDGDSDSEYADSDELISFVESDDEGKPRKLEFNENTDFKKPIHLIHGLRFTNAIVFRKAFREHCVSKGHDYKFLHNDRWRATAESKKVWMENS